MTVTITALMARHPFEGYLEGYPDYLDPARAAADEFARAHPGYRIEITGCDFEEMPGEVARLAAEGRAPDIAEYYYSAVQLAHDTLDRDGRPLFTSVERAVGGRTEILGEPVLLGDLEPAVRAYYSRDGELVSMPASVTTMQLYGNAALLERARVGMPRTWQELRDACAAVRALPGGPRAGLTLPNHGWLLQQFVAVQGGLLADAGNGRSGRARRVRLTSRELLAFVRWCRGMAAEGHYVYTGSPGWFDSIDLFAGQQVAFTVNSSKIARDIIGAGAEGGFPVAVGPVPYNEDVPYAGTVISGGSLWLADGLDDVTQDGALAFLQYLLNPANAVRWHRAQGYLPVTRTSVEVLEREGWFADHPEELVPTLQVRSSDCSPAALGAVLGDFAGIQDAMTAAIEDVLLDGVEPGTRFAAAEAEAQRLLDAYTEHVVGGDRPRTPVALAVG
jgi:sn-glycerol 3-phosphate transport system substrate-binding protein